MHTSTGPRADLFGGAQMDRAIYVGVGTRAVPGSVAGKRTIAGAGAVAVNDAQVEMTGASMPAEHATPPMSGDAMQKHLGQK